MRLPAARHGHARGPVRRPHGRHRTPTRDRPDHGPAHEPAYGGVPRGPRRAGEEDVRRRAGRSRDRAGLPARPGRRARRRQGPRPAPGAPLGSRGTAPRLAARRPEGRPRRHARPRGEDPVRSPRPGAPVALAAAIGGGTAAAVQMQPARTVPDYASTAPAPAASIYAAAPVASPAALTRPKTAVRKARPIVTQVPADGPAPVPVPSPSPSPLPSSPAAPLLTVPRQPGRPRRLREHHDHDRQPAGPARLLVGRLRAGRHRHPRLGVPGTGPAGMSRSGLSINPADGASAASCLFEPGDERLTVTWAGAGAPSGAAG